MIEPWKDYIFRSHILKLNPGGYFPPHRDSTIGLSALRLIVPLENCNPPDSWFIIEKNNVLSWNIGSLYFINTAKVHTLFTSSSAPSYWIVFNVKTTNESVGKILKYSKYI
jgi:hypothetical protein